MVFKVGDKDINRDGRPVGKQSLEMKNKSTVTNDDLQLMLRKLKPLTTKALKKLGIIIEEGTETGQIKAITLVLKEYSETREKVIASLKENSEEDEQDKTDKVEEETAKMFSLKMVNNTKE